MALVLAIEPDLRQAEILKRIVREKVKADVVIVDSRDAAVEAMRSAMPDVMLVSALLSPRDEDELVAHLRTREDAEHLQTHTIPQLASAGGEGPSGPARGLLKAFLRKKETAPTVAGCDPDLFAQEIRLYLDQADEKRRERAEQRQYRPASVKPIAAAAQEPKLAEGEPQMSGASASWDSPFEWRKTDTTPAPLSSFEEEPAPAPAFDRFEPAGDDVDSEVNAHLLEESSLEAAPIDAVAQDQSFNDIVPEPAPEPVISGDRLIETAADADAPELLETFVPAPAAEPASAPIELPAAPVALAAFEPQAELEPPPLHEPVLEIDSVTEPPPSAVEPVAAAAEAPDSSVVEIEAFGRTSVREIEYPRDTLEEIQRMFAALQDTSSAPQVVPAPDDPLAIDCLIDAEAIESSADALPAVVAAEAAPEQRAAVEEPVDLSWTNVQDPQPDEEEVALAVEETPEVSQLPPPARNAPPNLGPLATWARLERKAEEERRPGSDMREIIERLAVPPHIAGVSYARGVRIRRVRVAGTRDRRRPPDQAGPVILSRRALASTRTGGPAANA